MIEESVIQEGIVRLLRAAPPGSRVILFGSHARGDADARSDVDLMVIEREVTDKIAEALRLQATLDSLRLPVDVIVTSVADFDYWKETVNTLYYRIAREGKAYEAPG